MLKIGNLNIENKIFLAPMAGVTDRPFRLICKEFGAGFMYTEFVSANGIIRENQRTLDMINFSDIERPLGVQIFGEEPSVLGESAKMIAQSQKGPVRQIPSMGCNIKWIK